MKVLLVIAQNTSVRQALQAALPSSDTALFEHSVEEASRRLVSLQPDAIVLDDGPGLGLDAIAAVKGIAPQSPVIALSSRGDLLSQAALTRAGADEVIVKPFSYELLQQAIDKKSARYEVLPVLPAGVRPAPGRSAYLTQHQMALRWLSRAANYTEDPAHLSHSLVEATADIFDCVRSAVLLESEGAVRIAASIGLPESLSDSLRLGYTSGIMRFFDERACLLDRDQVQDSGGAIKQMQLLSARLAAPLLKDGRVFGAILLGEKASGTEYSPEERELLTLLARSTSTAFERSAQHNRARLQHGKLDAVLEHLDAGVVTVGHDKSITLINRAAAELLHVRQEEMLGRSVQKLGSAFADVALRTLVSGETKTEVIFDPAINARLQLSPSSMNGSGVVIVFSRAPETQVATENIAYSPFWEYLSSRVAQEIKNPMVAINTFAQLLPKKYDSEDFRDAFSRIVQKEVERINGVVETLFSFARNPSLTLQACSVNATLQEVLRRFERELSEHAIQLQAEFDPAVADAEIDPQHFSRAVEHIVQNSIEAMPQGGTLTVYTKTEGDQTEIGICDTGAGVARENESLIFLPFFSTKERGMGLGLPLATRILEQHQGDLKLVRGESGGARFAMHLPARQRRPLSPEANHADNSGD